MLGVGVIDVEILGVTLGEGTDPSSNDIRTGIPTEI
jgi:hypothetical protein